MVSEAGMFKGDAGATLPACRVLRNRIAPVSRLYGAVSPDWAGLVVSDAAEMGAVLAANYHSPQLDRTIGTSRKMAACD
jgi:hypothetical protein